MKKTDLLFHMMEQPHNYSEEEWQKILADEECHELYSMMAKTKSAYSPQNEISDKDIDAEWQRLEKEHPYPSFFTHHTLFTKIAAMLIAVLMLSGIGLAAIHFARNNNQKPEAVDTTATVNISAKKTYVKKEYPDTISKMASPVVFDNVPLDEIALAIASFHHLEVEVRNKQAYGYRFYFVWKQEDSLQTVIEQLNQFESVDIIVENGKVIVK